MVTSILYHWAEISGSRIFGMSSGNWHRLDNVFGILIAQSLFLYFADFHSAEVNELFRWLCLVVTLFFQEKGPWLEINMILPIVFAAHLMIVKFLYDRRVPNVNQNLLWGFVLSVIGVYFFYKGLDNEHDWLRLSHGLWHSFIGAATYFFMCSKENSSQSDVQHQLAKNTNTIIARNDNTKPKSS